jgi:hypothetical protein
MREKNLKSAVTGETWNSGNTTLNYLDHCMKMLWHFMLGISESLQ